MLFQFWYIILQLKLIILIYVRSIREGNVPMYIVALRKLVPFFFVRFFVVVLFSFRTINARWIPVHLRDKLTLKAKHPSIYKEVLSGNFKLIKTTHFFSQPQLLIRFKNNTMPLLKVIEKLYALQKTYRNSVCVPQVDGIWA